MVYLRLALLSFIPLISFFILPVSGYVKDTIYTPRIILIVGMAIIGNLILFHLYSGKKSLLGAMREVLRPRPLKLAIVSYAIWLCVSSSFSVMPGYSWLGHPYTQFGTIALLGCLSLAYLYYKVMRAELIMRIMSFCVLVMAALTFLESLGYRPLSQVVQSPNMLYPAALVGHRPHLGGWFSIVVLMPAYFYRDRKLDGWFWAWTLSGIIGLGLCTTTSATLGVGFALSLWLLYSWLKRRERFKSVLLLVAAFAISVATLPSIVQSVGAKLKLNPPQLKDYGSTGSMEPRLYMWKSAWHAATDRPWTGWGTDTFGYQVFEHLENNDAEALFRAELGFKKDYVVEHKGMTYYAYKREGADKDEQTGSLLYVRPHNLIVDELYSNGFIGLILFFLAATFFIKRIGKAKIPSSLPYFAISCLPYFIYLQAWFYIVSVTPIFFILLGIMLKDSEQGGSKYVQR
ncbi:MAG: O-antigen ligase family protein [Deinococcus sp.]|uniref:O-antigen ligase family protein n=1 Tax=Deinococcus sp. TaxID=47478 RepID=UPI0026DADD82|nr:O-antigen ligase family protein [Deinococcus sp.]MDO4246515.1 O-antigen ligase family protein [Deinococcus sp.]